MQDPLIGPSVEAAVLTKPNLLHTLIVSNLRYFGIV